MHRGLLPVAGAGGIVDVAVGTRSVERGAVGLGERASVAQALGVDPEVYSSVGGEGEQDTGREARAEAGDETTVGVR